MHIDEDGRPWAGEFDEILPALRARPDLRSAILGLLRDLPGGGGSRSCRRLARFREVLAELVAGDLTLDKACRETERRLPRPSPVLAAGPQAVPALWAERLVRTRLSRLYSWAVLAALDRRGDVRCFVPQPAAPTDGRCSPLLAGSEHDIGPLLNRLAAGSVSAGLGCGPRLPEHPFCCHVVSPSPRGLDGGERAQRPKS